MKRRRNPAPSDWHESLSVDRNYTGILRYHLVWYNDTDGFRLTYIHSPGHLEEHLLIFEWGPLYKYPSGIPVWRYTDYYTWEASPFDSLRLEEKYMKYIGMGNYMLLEKMHKRMGEVLPGMMKRKKKTRGRR